MDLNKDKKKPLKVRKLQHMSKKEIYNSANKLPKGVSKSLKKYANKKHSKKKKKHH